MKNLSIFLSLFVLLTAFTPTHIDHYKVNPTKSKLIWKAEKVTGGHYGHVSLKSGKVMMDHGKIAGANFIVDMTTISNEDIESEKYRDKLVEHLKNEDFFNVEKHPEVSFNMMNSTPMGNGKFNVFGELTIKGNKNVISFPLELTESKSDLIVKGSFSFDRTKYDIIYGSGTFFDNLGDKAIDNTVSLDFEIHLSK